MASAFIYVCVCVCEVGLSVCMQKKFVDTGEQESVAVGHVGHVGNKNIYRYAELLAQLHTEFRFFWDIQLMVVFVVQLLREKSIDVLVYWIFYMHLHICIYINIYKYSSLAEYASVMQWSCNGRRTLLWVELRRKYYSLRLSSGHVYAGGEAILCAMSQSG